MGTTTRKIIRVEGIVQGVGFRPFIYRLAKLNNLTGYVLNDSEGVLIEVQGENLSEFIESIKNLAPPAAFIANIIHHDLPIKTDERNFLIKPSPHAIERETLISPDLAICEDCKREILDSTDRRYRYAFTNCTNCGPRFSIVEDIPYDRQNTTMKNFIMCDKCQAEYDNPLDRRFHAQPNACSVCGPQYVLTDNQGNMINCSDILAKARELILAGYIVAVKGIGGYHLACDAKNYEAVAKLRERKVREDKPFAVMASDLATIKKYCTVDSIAAKLLTSTSAPIVLLPKSKQYNLAENVAVHNAYIGFMLAYAPVHYLLLNSGDVFVMTSANLSEEPIVYRNDEEYTKLAKIADFILSHNRPINTRVDDSVVRIFEHEPMIMRRSRGFAPAPISLGGLINNKISVLACGGELKNTFCLTKQDKAFMSQHIGDLENMAVNNAYKQSIKLFERLFDIKPNLLACDMHPEYFSTKYAKAQELPFMQVQHHHAHIASVLAEHGITDTVIGVALDGTGYGEDKCIWGGEFMLANLQDFKRIGHFAYMPLPSGAKAVKEPWRLGLYQAYTIYGEDVVNKYPKLIQPNWQLLMKATSAGFNAPLTSSAGRIFDTVAALLNIRTHINYEGQAAIELENRAFNSEGEILPYAIKQQDGQYILDFKPLYASIYGLKQRYSVNYVAKSFHMTLAEAICEVINKISNDTGIKQVALSGGVCQNITLLKLIYQNLNSKYKLYLNRKLPPNDGGLAFGQAAIALYRYKMGLIDL